jgi:hypothetical protein
LSGFLDGKRVINALETGLQFQRKKRRKRDSETDFGRFL